MSSRELAKLLLKKPIKENYLETPHIQVKGAGEFQQADLIYLTNDKGYKYALVVVDLGNRLCDAEKLKSRDAEAVLKAFKKIYERGILKLPKFITTDPGSEFKGVVKKYFKDNDVYHKFSPTGRTNSQALAESRNREIGKEIMLNQLTKEIKNKKVNKEWIKDLPDIISELNRRYEVKKFKPLSDDPIITKRNKTLLTEGDRVRLKLDKPQDFFGTKLSGRFRAADIRWTPKIYKIDLVLIRPSYPPMYYIKDTRTAYTRGQLQLVE